jgi:predicted AlkP superfamily phosphohydrolase/phosphomutase
MVDWSRTTAWGMGGYYGRMFLNVKDREPEGIVNKKEYNEVRNKLINDLEHITDEHGKNIGTKVFKPEETYEVVNNIAPDLIVYFGNLTWRSMGTVGNKSNWLHENDTGPDDANHAQQGMVLINNGKAPRKITEVRNTVLKHFGIM